MVGADGSIAGPSGRVLRQTLNSQGYPVISTRRGGRGRVHPVHIIACETFHGPRPEGMEAAHGNGIPTDCQASNLRWATPAENSADRIKHGTQTRGVAHGRARLTDDAVRAIRASSGSDRELARQFGVNRRTVAFVREGKTWRHVA